jgi:hypothetical protein
LRLDDLFLLEPVFFGGTFSPACRASERPIAIACLRLFTFFPELPDRSVPCFRSCMVFATLSLAPLLYLRVLFFFAAIDDLTGGDRRSQTPGQAHRALHAQFLRDLL